MYAGQTPPMRKTTLANVATVGMRRGRGEAFASIQNQLHKTDLKACMIDILMERQCANPSWRATKNISKPATADPLDKVRSHMAWSNNGGGLGRCEWWPSSQMGHSLMCLQFQLVSGFPNKSTKPCCLT
jgi:hypothetical protein